MVRCNNNHQMLSRENLLKTGCVSCITEHADWGVWAHTDGRKELLLKSRCRFAIQQVQEWGDWTNTECRGELLLRTNCNTAIEQVRWGEWAHNEDRKMLLLKSQCEAAISQVRWGEWANGTNRVERRSFIFNSKSVATIALLNNWEKERSLFTLLLSGGHLGNFTIQYNLNNNDDDPATLRVFQIMGLIDYIAAYMDGDKNIIGESVLEKIGARTLVDRDGVTASGSGVSQGANKC